MKLFTPNRFLVRNFSLICSLLIVLFFSVGKGWGQIPNYTFSQSNGNYTEITGGTLHGTADNANYSFSLPFSFIFDGVSYTVVRPTTNGFLVLGSSAPSASQYTPLSSGTTNFAIAALSRDLYSTVRSEVLGVAPNRIYVCQWSNAYRYSNTTGDNLNAQIRLYESTNEIEIIYGGMANTNTAVGTGALQVGLRGSSTSVYQNRSTTTDWTNTTAGSANNSTCALTTAIKPSSGLIFKWTPPSPCAGTPAPGNTLASVNPVGGGSSTVLSLQYTTIGSGVTYQWKSSTDNVTYNSISGATSATYSATPTVPTYYVCEVTCSGTTTASNPLQVNLTYCTPIATGASAYISSVSLSTPINSISNNTSAQSSNGYGNFIGQFVSGWVGSTINYSSSIYNVSGGICFAIYIDWNNDFDFLDLGEKVVALGESSQITTNPSGTFSVPSGVNQGSYRMRVVMSFSTGTVSSCYTTLNGEVEDYTLNVIAQPTCMVPTPLTSSSISYQTATIGWTAPTTGTSPGNYEYEIRTSGAAGSGAAGLVTSGTVSTNSANITGLNGGTTYTYYVRSSCGSGDFSFWVSSTFTTLSCASLPTLVAASSITTSSATISWTAAASGTPAGYEYEVRTSGTAGSGASGLFATNTTTSPVVSANISGLSPATTYTIFVRTVCYSGFNSNWTSAVTFNSGCEAPLSLAASATSSAQTFTTISGSFAAASSNPPTGYIVVRSTSATAPSTLAAATTLPTVGSTWNSISGTNVDYIGTSASTWTSTGLTNSTTYYYYIFSYNNTNCSGGPVYSTTAYTFSQSTQTCPSFASTISINGAAAVPGTSYPTLTAAIADIKFCGVSQPTIFELTTGYLPASETYPILLSSIPGASSTNTLTIREASSFTGVNITSANTTATIDINGGQYWIIDGRPGGIGAADLSFGNTGSAPVWRFINDGSNNVIRYCNATSAVSSTTSGLIIFSTTSGTTGNDNNTIDNCNLNGGGGTANIIYASGTNTSLITNNSGVTISNNLIRDFYTSSTDASGICISSGNTDWNIIGNSFYWTASRSGVASSRLSGIFINNSTSGNNFNISGNYIGGTAPNCGGTAMTVNGTAASYRFRGISLQVGTTVVSSIQNNTIANISWITTSGAAALPGTAIGIYLGAGNANIGNNLGNNLSNWSIQTTGNGGVCYGIGSESTSSTLLNISNNILSNLNISGSTTSISHSYVGIQTTAGSSIVINNNTLGSTQNPNSINVSTAYTGTTIQKVAGIENTSNASISIINNTISNLNNAYVPSSFQSNLNSIACGISSSAGTATISNNTIRNLTAAANSTNTGLKSSVIGISATMNTGSTISQNTIYALKSSCASGTTISVTGIAYSAAATGSNIIDKNTIYNLANLSSSSGRIQGIYTVAGLSNVQNNMISLGLDESGADITLPVSIYGFYELAGTNNFYHNTVNILGTNVTSNTTIPSTSAFYCYAATATRNVKNNIFVNVRSNASASGGPKNYAVYFPSSGVAGTCDYNIYQANGVGSVFGSIAGGDRANFTTWKAYSATLDPNSIDALPTFTSTTDLHLNPAANCSLDNKGTYIAAVTTDIDGASRSNSTPDIGADEFTFSGANVTWTGGTSNVVTNTANWAGGILPSTCSNVIIQSGSANYPSYITLTIDPGTTYTLQSGAQLTISGTLTNNGTLTLESGATLVQESGSTLAGSGTYNVKQAITGDGTTTPSGRFWYLGSPVSLASSSVYFASNAANVVKKRSESTNAWTALSSGTPENLVVGQGYYTQAIPANSTINFTGGLLNNDAISITNLTRTAGQGFEGFNLVSNPYPSYLDWDAVTKTDVGNTMWYRTHNGTAMVFDTYVAGTGGIGTNLNGNGVSNLIPPMQSFWVRVNSGSSTGSLAVNNTMRSHFTSINGSVAGLKSTANERDLFLRMNLLQANKKDQLIVYVNEQATNGFDILDGEKMMQAGFPQFYTKAGDKKIVINGLNSAKKQQALPVTIELPTTGVHSFVIEDLEISNGLVWLEDKQEEIIQALEPGTVYEFYANSGINSERFVLHFQLIDDAVPTNVYNEVNSSANFSGKGANVYAESAGVVVIKLPASAEGVTDIQIRDAAGKLVYAGSMNNLETSVELAQANGIYYVTLSSNTGVEVRKVFIQQ